MQNFIKSYTQPAFLICVILLAIAGAGMQVTVDWFGVQLQKEALPLKKPLELFVDSLLTPYKVVKNSKIKNKDVLEQLGTDEYLQIILEDTESQELSPVRFCSLFVTYYTGDPDMVPHVPDECYIGGGNVCLGRDTVTLQLANLNREGKTIEAQDSDTIADNTNIDVKYLTFSKKNSDIWQVSSKFNVWYFFKVNGEYSGGRTQTRKILGENLLGKYSYFSKIEWTFHGQNQSTKSRIDKETALKASEKLMSVILPILEKEYYPDWEKANRKQNKEAQDTKVVSVR